MGPLAGVKIVEFAGIGPAPMAAMLLADMGAEVLKIERPKGGDDARAWGPPFLDGESLWFASVNRNKRSVALDFSSAEGLDKLNRLVRVADVVMVNFAPRVAKKLKVDVDTLRAFRPDLVYVSITGFGLTGERADWTCYDLIAEGYSGIMDITGEAGGEPQKIGAPAADMLAGQDAAFATVAALFDRRRSGKGHVVDVALVDSMTRFLSCRIVSYLGSGEIPKRSGGRDSVIAIYQVFDAADAPLTLGLGNDAIWKRFWAAVGRRARGEEARHRSNSDRRAARAEIVAEIQAILATRPRAEWLRIFSEAKVPAGPINRLDEVAVDPELAARQLFYAIPGDQNPIPQVGLGIRIDDSASGPALPPPRLGEHSDEVLAEWAGYDAQRISALRAEGII
jgi:crotonobetainyl-CoA:carnitine CoA-transferase CaiB-like acyl-CoA transferase